MRFSSEIGSGGCLSPEDERDLASLVDPAMHPRYNARTGWWTVVLLVKTMAGRPSYEGKGRTFAYALSSAIAAWRVDRRVREKRAKNKGR